MLSKANSYGTGACAYLRRILENRIDPLIELLRANVDEEESPQSPRVAEIDSALAGKQFDVKAKLANSEKLVPPSLYLHGANPFTLLHGAYSQAIHAKDEDSALEIAERLSRTLE